jgi:acetyl-CoA carboxylase carboxyl transferase subunit beta
MPQLKKSVIEEENRVKIPEGLWVKCDNCKEIVYRKEVDKHLKVCPNCSYHFRLTAFERIGQLVDHDSFKEIGQGLQATDPINFVDQIPYKERIERAKERSQTSEAAVAGHATIGHFDIVLVVMDFFFMGGSMGTIVGEKFTSAAEEALKKQVPLICVSSSGGARMHEGILSLMQMAKTAAAAARLKEKNIPYISILADPTFGGVTASFAMLGDIIIAEPGSLIGFAGPRVIEQTINQQLPPGFQRAEFQLKHGMIDMIIPRKDLKEKLVTIIAFFIDARTGTKKKHSKKKVASTDFKK